MLDKDLIFPVGLPTLYYSKEQEIPSPGGQGGWFHLADFLVAAALLALGMCSSSGRDPLPRLRREGTMRASLLLLSQFTWASWPGHSVSRPLCSVGREPSGHSAEAAWASLAGWNPCPAVMVRPSPCFLVPLWFRLFVFLLLFTLSQPPKCVWTTWLSLPLGKQSRWPAAQLIQSWHKGFKERPADRLRKAWVETALTSGHRDTQCTAQGVPGALGRTGKCICLHLCACLYISLYDIKKKKIHPSVTKP